MHAFLLCLVMIASAPVPAQSRWVTGIKYILARADGTLTMAASVDDIPYAQSLQQKYGQPILVVQEGGHLYVIVEEQIIAQVEKVTKRSEPIDRQREELRKRRKQMDKLEDAITDRLERAEEAIDRASDSGDRERARQLKPQLNAAKEELRQLRPAQLKLESEERVLDAKQDQISAEVEATIQQVAHEAIAKGTAIKVR